MDKVSIVIVNWNTGELLARCLESLMALPEQDLVAHVVVIDNASGDDSMKRAQSITKEWPKVSFISLESNVGFAKANTIGIDSLATKGTHILLLNPDTEMKPGSLQALVTVLSENDAVGIVGPKLLNTDGSIQESVRTFPTFGVLAGMFLKLHRLLPGLAIWRNYFASDFDYSREQSVDQVMGACFLIRNELFIDIGSLDEGFWIWFEEVDYCKRAHTADWAVLYTPSAEVMHHGGASFHQLVGFKKSWPFLRSALCYARKHFSSWEVLVLYILLPFALLLILPSSLVHFAQRKQTKVTV
jgi:N-acetylglucosaminyl-diphospho-decaprenol L-rhamnosyltransferase